MAMESAISWAFVRAGKTAARFANMVVLLLIGLLKKKKTNQIEIEWTRIKKK